MDNESSGVDLKKGSSNNFISKLKSIFSNEETLSRLPSFLRNKKVTYSLLGLVVLIVILMFTSLRTAETNIPTFTVKKDNFLVSITESGELRAKNSISITTPRVRGNLKIIYLAPEGSYVKAGDVVVKFDPTEAMNNLKEAESKLEIAQSEKEKLIANQKSQMTRLESDLKSAELSFELSKLKLEQIKFEADIKQQEAKLEHEKNELSYKKAKQDLESQKIVDQSEFNKVEIDVRQKQADLEHAKRDLAMLTLTAPTEGLVVYETNWSSGRKVTIGDTPWPGMPVVSLPDLSTMESFTYVNEVDVSRVKKGQRVIVKLDAFQDSTFQGEISSVAALGKTKNNNSTIKVFEITVSLNSQSSILKPGMTTSNKMIINEIPNVLFVPQESVFEKEGKKIVYIKNGSSFDEQDVETGDKSEDYIVIKKGLSKGEVITLRDPTIKLEENVSEQSGETTPALPSTNKQ